MATKLVMIMVLVGVLLFATMVCCVFSATTLVLERMGSPNVEQLIAKDHLRNSHMHGVGVPNFPLIGHPHFRTYGFYFTRVKLGSPPREYQLLIDTGSDITWVNCISCTGCPHSSTLVDLSLFDPRSSSSATPVSCTDPICSRSSLCSYSIPYAGANLASGYYVSDTLQLDTIVGYSATANSSGSIVFGCTTNQSGSLTEPQSAVDGLLGLGHHRMSVISQLASHGKMPNVFSHCLKGDDKGGGILVLGEIVEPRIIYSPLVPSQRHYNLNLLSISVRGQRVPIDPIVFSASENRAGTIVDSGTTLAYLTEEAYNPFITALVAAAPPSVTSFPFEGCQCFQFSHSIRDAFPLVSLDFEGGASMVVKPKEYLLLRISNASPDIWCVGFRKNKFQNAQGLTLLGDIVLKDKIVVYDLARQRLGWADYNCSSSVNVSLVPPRVSSSSRDIVLNGFLTGSLSLILMSVGSLFL